MQGQRADPDRLRGVVIPPLGLDGVLEMPAAAARGLVVFAHGNGSSRRSPRNRFVADRLQAEGMATLLFDLLTPEEASDRSNVFDIPLLAERLLAATGWARRQEDVGALPIGYFGASTGAAAALVGAAKPGNTVAAVVSRGGRPDLAGPALARVGAPTLFIVGGEDPEVLALNRAAMGQMRCPAELHIVAGATHLFEEPGALEAVVAHAARWFVRYLHPAPAGANPQQG